MFCPNRDCPHAKRTGEPAEYRPGFSVCHDCATPLVEERPIATAVVEEAVPPGMFVPVLKLRNEALVPAVESLLMRGDIPFFIRSQESSDPLDPEGFNVPYVAVTGPPTVYVESSSAEEARRLLEELEPPGDDESDEERATELAGLWLEAWASRELDSLPLDPDFVRSGPAGAFRGLRSYLAAVGRTRRAPFDVVVTGTLAEGDQVAVRYELRAGDTTLEACDWIRIREETIAEVRSYYDSATFRKMYGELPVP